MSAALGLIGLGVSAVSTVAGLSSGASSSRAQKQAIADQQLASDDRLKLLKENFEFSQKWSLQAAKSELLTLQAQKQQAQQAITEQVLGNQMQLTQARLEAKGIKSQTLQAVSKLLGDAYNQSAQSSVGNANALEAGVGMLKEAENELNQAASQNSMNGTVNSQSKSGLSKQEAYANQAIEQLTRLQENVLSADAQSGREMGNTNRAAAITGKVGTIQANYANSTADIQQQSNDAFVPYARRQVKSTLKRNKLGVLARNYSNAASASASYAAAQAGERTTQSQLAQQSSQIKSPGFLSLLTAAGNIANQGQQLGIFRFGGGGAGAAPASPPIPTSGQGQRNYVMPTTSQLKNVQSVYRPAPISPRTYNQYTDVTGNTYG